MDVTISSYQDLLNEDINLESVENIQQEVDDLEIRVALNETNIGNNTTNISLLNNDMLQNRQQIINNENLILTNISNIATNTSNITTLNNTVLLKDGSVDLDSGYNPSNAQSIATKDYVDTHSTSGNYLRVDGSNSMIANLNLNNNNLININELVFPNFTVSELNNALDFKIGLSDILQLTATNIIPKKNILISNIINPFIQFNLDFIIQSTVTETIFNNLINQPFVFKNPTVTEVKITPGINTEFTNDVKINGDLLFNSNSSITEDSINQPTSLLLGNTTTNDEVKIIPGTNTEFKNDVKINGDLSFVNGHIDMNDNLIDSVSELIFNLGSSIREDTVNQPTALLLGNTTYHDEVRILPNTETEFKNNVIVGGELFVNNNGIINLPTTIIREYGPNNISFVIGNTTIMEILTNRVRFWETIYAVEGVDFDNIFFVGHYNTGTSFEALFQVTSGNYPIIIGNPNHTRDSINILSGTSVTINDPLIVNDPVTINSNITLNGDISLTGNLSCVDVNASGDISCLNANVTDTTTTTTLKVASIENVDTNLINIGLTATRFLVYAIITVDVIEDNGAGEVKVNSDLEVTGDINLQANQIMDYGYNATGRATNTTEGKITYSTITPSYTLNIYGGLDATAQGQGVNRLTQIFGDVYVGDINTFHINSGSGANGDCKLILESNDDSTNQQSTPQILFRCDSSITQGAVYLNDNSLDIVSAVNSGGDIRFLTTTTDGDYTNANLALGITNNNQDVVVERNLGIQEAVDVDNRCYLQFARNNQNRDLSVKTGEINYQTNTVTYGHVLNIYGGRQSGSTEYRRIRMFDAVNIEGYLVVNNYATVNLSSFRYYAYSSYGGLSSGNVNVSIHATNGRIVAVEFNAVSDRRCKEDITNITDETVERYMKLEPKLFNWKKDESKKKYFGYIAQDVIYNSIDDEKKGYDALAHLVNFVDDTTMKEGVDITGVNDPEGKCMNINYDGCIPILHKALQIEREKNKILEDRIKILEQRLNKIENILNIV